MRVRSATLVLACLLAASWAGVAHAQDGEEPAGDADAGTPDAGAGDGGEGWTEDDEAWAAGEDDEEGWSEEEEGAEEAGEEEASEEAAEEEEEEEPGEASVGEDDESVEGQEGGLLPPAPPVRHRPALPEPGDDDFSLVLPPILYQRQGGVETIAGFPLFYLRQSEETTELSIPPYYMMRGEENWDVLFPLFFWYRGEGHHTWIVPPLWHHEAPDGHDFGLAPIVMTGRHGPHHYTVIPPLLTLDWGVDDIERYTFSAALFWRIWENDAEHWGVFPFLWVENTESSSYTIAPPVFFRFEDRDEGTALTVVPPFYHRDEPNGSYWGIPPLFHHNSGPGHTSTTIFPLLSHYSEEAEVFRLTLGGIFWYWRDHGDETIVTPLYQRFRGATEMDAVAPFFFYIRDPRTDATTLAIPPLVWHLEDPTTATTVVAPFFVRHEERGRSTTWWTPLVANHQDHEAGDETTWVFPTIQVSNWHNGDAVNIHPIWYYESVPSHRYVALVPFWFDIEEFEGDRNRYTVAFPFFWRFREGNTTSTLVMNVYHRERVRSESWDWEFHIFPFFSYGENSQGGHWWKIFYGLAGYERRGQYGVTTLFYVPFQTDGPPLPTE